MIASIACVFRNDVGHPFRSILKSGQLPTGIGGQLQSGISGQLDSGIDGQLGPEYATINVVDADHKHSIPAKMAPF